jgi:hypothetical protein
MTIFDDAANPQKEPRSRAIILDLNLSAMHCTLRQEFVHPHKRLLTDAMGSAQLLPDGRMFVGWGALPYFSEFDAQGKLILDGAVTKLDPSYRAFTADWTGHPDEAPAIAVRPRRGGATVYASWNGATDVAAWRIGSGPLVRRSGFETALALRPGAVVALDAHGRALGSYRLP